MAHSGQTDGVIHLDKPRRLRWTLAALEQIDELQKQQIPPVAFAVQVLHLGLKWEDSDLTLDTVKELVHTDNLADVMEAVNAVMKRMNTAGDNGSPLAGKNSGQ